MKLTSKQRAKFGQALNTDQQSKVDATINRTRQIEDMLRNYVEWTPEDVVQIQYDALGQVLQVKIHDSVFEGDYTTQIALQSALVRVFDIAFKGAGTLRTKHTANVVDMYMPNLGGKHDDTSGA